MSDLLQIQGYFASLLRYEVPELLYSATAHSKRHNVSRSTSFLTNWRNLEETRRSSTINPLPPSQLQTTHFRLQPFLRIYFSTCPPLTQKIKYSGIHLPRIGNFRPFVLSLGACFPFSSSTSAANTRNISEKSLRVYEQIVPATIAPHFEENAASS